MIFHSFSDRCLLQVRSEMQDDVSEHDSDLDLDNNIKAIGGYVDDRETMIEHMFRSISKSKLHAMLPEILRVSDVTMNAGLQSKLYSMLPVSWLCTGCDVCVCDVRVFAADRRGRAEAAVRGRGRGHVEEEDPAHSRR